MWVESAKTWSKLVAKPLSFRNVRKGDQAAVVEAKATVAASGEAAEADRDSVADARGGAERAEPAGGGGGGARA